MQSLFHHQLKYYYSLVVCSHFLVAELVRLLWIRNHAPCCCQSPECFLQHPKGACISLFLHCFRQKFCIGLISSWDDDPPLQYLISAELLVVSLALQKWHVALIQSCQTRVLDVKRIENLTLTKLLLSICCYNH